MFDLLSSKEAMYKGFMFSIIKNRDIIAFGLSILLCFIVDPILKATIYGGSIVRFLLVTYFSYLFSHYLANGNIFYTYIALRFASTKKLKLKVFLNGILNSAFQVMLLTVALFLFVFALRVNMLQFAVTIADKYNVPFESFKSIFKHVPFVVLHFAFLYGI